MKKIQAQSQETVQRMKAERDVKIQECEEIRTQVTISHRKDFSTKIYLFHFPFQPTWQFLAFNRTRQKVCVLLT